MFESRKASISDDIEPKLIRSEFTRELIGLYDTFLMNDELPIDLLLVDPYQKFFMVATDLCIIFESKLDSDNYVALPYVRMIYVLPSRRGIGLQARLLGELTGIADDVGESFAIVADPFVLGGNERELNVYQSIAKLKEHGEEPPEKYMEALVKQTKRFKTAGLTNVKFSHSQITEPYQEFVYISKTEDQAKAEILWENKVDYLIDYKKLENC